MALTQMRLHIVGVNRGTITENGLKWCRVQTTEAFEANDDVIGMRACDMSGKHEFFDELKRSGVVLPADLDCMVNISITKKGAKATVESLVVAPTATKKAA